MLTRMLVLMSFSLAACDDAPEETPATETAPSPNPEAAPETPPAAPELETTEGFVEATIDGEQVRYEYLAKNDNRATTRASVVAAHAGPEREEGLRVIMSGIDVRTVEYPAALERDTGAIARGDLRGAMRMTALNYMDAEGKEYAHVFRNGELQCQSYEAGVLRCTFECEASSEEAPSVQVTDGRLEVRLADDALTDAIIEGIGGAAADESLDRAQKAVDAVRMR